jgi:hypothetical protein
VDERCDHRQGGLGGDVDGIPKAAARAIKAGECPLSRLVRNPVGSSSMSRYPMAL